MPATADDPEYVATIGVRLASIAVALSAICTLLVCYFHSPDGISQYLIPIIGSEPHSFLHGMPSVHDALVNT